MYGFFPDHIVENDITMGCDIVQVCEVVDRRIAYDEAGARMLASEAIACNLTHAEAVACEALVNGFDQ